jgi:hypothetical protein
MMMELVQNNIIIVFVVSLLIVMAQGGNLLSVLGITPQYCSQKYMPLRHEQLRALIRTTEIETSKFY